MAKHYRVLVTCINDKSGKYFRPGDIVTGKDFPAAVIKNWLEITPPVLMEIVDNGSDPKRQG